MVFQNIFMNPLLFASAIFIILYFFWYFISFVELIGLFKHIFLLRNYLGARIEWFPYPLKLKGEMRRKKFCIFIFSDPRWFIGPWFWNICINYRLYDNFGLKAIITKERWEQFCGKQNIPEDVKKVVNNLFDHGFEKIKISAKQIKLSRSWAWPFAYDAFKKTELNLSSVASAVKVLEGLIDLAEAIVNQPQYFRALSQI
jgi:hypothetical protein